MKRFLAVAAFSCAIIVSLAGILLAGALDRQNVQPRTNPVTQSMIRVPGVVGQDQAAALMALQQAGLNPSVLKAKKMPKGLSGAAGMECRVVDQNPGAGGMAMYGTTVTVYVWKPDQCVAAGASTGASTGTPSYGTPSYGTTPQPAFPAGQATTVPVQQPMMPQGTQMQGGQGFQVQQYYFPDSSGQTPPAQQQTVDPAQQQPQQTQPPPLPPQ